MKAYSVDLRRRILDDCDAGMGTKVAAEKYSVSPSWVRKLKRQHRETASDWADADRVGWKQLRSALEPRRERRVEQRRFRRIPMAT